MPVPRHSVMLPSVQLGADAGSGGVTELRVHGVGGSPPDATLGDLAPEQVMGDAIAGFYRTSDHKASPEDRDARRDVDRHVEVYSWGGLTSRSKIRVLWLAVRPPYQVGSIRKAKPRKITAAALEAGLADTEFWDGEGSVRALTWLHVAVAGGFLAVALGITAKALTATATAQDASLAWAGIIAGGVTVALGAAYSCLDALGTPPAGASSAGKTPALEVLSEQLGRLLPLLLVPAGGALTCSGAFAWVQPA